MAFFAFYLNDDETLAAQMDKEQVKELVNTINVTNKTSGDEINKAF